MDLIKNKIFIFFITVFLISIIKAKKISIPKKIKNIRSIKNIIIVSILLSIVAYFNLNLSIILSVIIYIFTQCINACDEYFTQHNGYICDIK